MPSCIFLRSVTLTLEDEIDLSRGEMLVHPDNVPHISRYFEAMLVWMDEKDMERDQQYFIKQTTNTTRVHIERIRYKVDVNTMEQSMTDALTLNEIGRAVFVTNKPIFFDSYKKNKSCGSFVLIDPITNNTCAVGMIIDEVKSSDLASTITETDRKKMQEGISAVTLQEREKHLGHEGRLFNVVGNNLAAQRECAYMLERRLFDIGHFAVVLDAETLGLKNRDNEAFAAIAETLVGQGLTIICIDLYGEVKTDAFTIGIDEETSQPVTRDKNFCSINRQHIAEAVENIINIKL